VPDVVANRGAQVGDLDPDVVDLNVACPLRLDVDVALRAAHAAQRVVAGRAGDDVRASRGVVAAALRAMIDVASRTKEAPRLAVGESDWSAGVCAHADLYAPAGEPAQVDHLVGTVRARGVERGDAAVGGG